MKNPAEEVISEISNWLETRGYYCRHIFVVDRVFMYLSNKIYSKHLEEFKCDFGQEIRLKGVSFDENGQKSDFEYTCGSDRLDDFISYLRQWLKRHSFPAGFFMVMSDLSLNMDEKLSDSQIHDFEKEFEVKCKQYSMSCNSNVVKYRFE